MNNSLRTGVIVRAAPRSRVYDVELDDGTTLRACLNGVGFFAPLIGIQTYFPLPENTKVAVLGDTPGVIIATLPSQTGDPASADASFMTPDGVPLGDFEQFEPEGAAFPPRPDADMIEGELALRNIYKVGVTVLTHVARLQAGERAKVETLLMDNMVRIVSDTFRHLSCMGERSIINDGGQLTDRTDSTWHEHEAWGLEKERDPKMGAVENGIPQDPEEAPTSGRWRFSQFLGHLGDMLHVFITDPVDAIGQLAQDRAGKFHVHIGADGTFILQSVSDIVFERVSRVLVPVEQKEFYHPDGNPAVEEPSSDFFDSWNFDPQKPWLAAFQLREYARWLAQYNAYARFLRKDKEWAVGAEAAVPEPSYANAEKTRESAMPAAQRKVRVTYATMRLMRDGSYVLFDGYGTSIMTAGGSAWVSAAKDLHLEAGRNITMTAGGSFFVKARKNVEITAVLGKLLAKARDKVSMWSERGPLMLRTLMKTDERGDPEAFRFNKPETGLVLDAPFSRTQISADSMQIETRGDLTPEPALRLSSLKDIVVQAGKEGTLKMAAKKVQANATRIAFMALDFLSLQGKAIDFGRVLMKTAGQRLMARVLEAENVVARRIVSGTERKGPNGHLNHVEYAESAAVEMPDPPDISEDYKSQARPCVSLVSDSMALRCDYLPKSEYGTEVLQQSLAQQVATGTHPAGFEFEEWDFAKDGDNGDPNAAYTHPWPGVSAKLSTHPSTKSLHTLSSDPPSAHTPVPTAPEEKPATFRYIS